jgi:hypothetical protein
VNYYTTLPSLGSRGEAVSFVTRPASYPSLDSPLPAALIRTPIILAAIALGTVIFVTVLRIFLRGRKRSALRRLILNPKQAESKLHWIMVKPGGRRHSLHKSQEPDWGALGRLRSLLSQISDSSLDDYLDEKYPRRPPPAVVRRELFVRRHSLPINRRCSVPLSPSSRFSSTSQTPALYTIAEDDEPEGKNRDAKLSCAPTSKTLDNQAAAIAESHSLDIADAASIARALLEASATSLATFESISLEETIGSASLQLPLPSSNSRLDSMARTGSDSSADSSILPRPLSRLSHLSGSTSCTSIEVSDSDACIIKRAQSLRVHYKRGTTITVSPTSSDDGEREQTNAVATMSIDTLPSVVVTDSSADAAAARARDSLTLSVASRSSGATLELELDDFPHPPPLVDVRAQSAGALSLSGGIQRSLVAVIAEDETVCQRGGPSGVAPKRTSMANVVKAVAGKQGAGHLPVGVRLAQAVGRSR